jgi:hypothetical protein
MTRPARLPGPGPDQLARWKAALAASRRQQRNRRSRPKNGIEAVTCAGMVRIHPAKNVPASQGGAAQKGTTP